MIVRKNLAVFFLFGVGFVLQACVAGVQLLPKQADQAEVKGTYTLILYGCRTANDIENMAVLVDEKSGYSLEVYALDAMYKTKNGLPGDRALSEANTFVRCGMHTVWQTVFRKITDTTGKTIAYELKPLYQPWEFKITEVLLSSYILNDSKVTAYFNLDPSVRRNINPLDRTK